MDQSGLFCNAVVVSLDRVAGQPFCRTIYLRATNQPRRPPTTMPSVKVAAIVSTG